MSTPKCIKVFQGNFHSIRKELGQWIRQNKDDFFSDTDTGDFRTYGYYKNKPVFPLKDGRLVCVEFDSSSYAVSIYSVYQVDKKDCWVRGDGVKRTYERNVPGVSITPCPFSTGTGVMQRKIGSVACQDCEYSRGYDTDEKYIYCVKETV